MTWVFIWAIVFLIIIGILFKGKIFTGKSDKEEHQTLVEARQLALSASNRDDFIQAIHDLYPFIHPKRATSFSELRPPLDYLELWREFHNLILPNEIEELAATRRLRWVPLLLDPIFLFMAAVFLFPPDTSPVIKASGVIIAICFSIGFTIFFLRAMPENAEQRVHDLKLMDERFRLFLEPDELSRHSSGSSQAQ